MRKVPTRAPNRRIAVAFLLAVAAFVASSVFVTFRLRSVSAEARAISTDAMPSVIALTTLRERFGELRGVLNVGVEAGAIQRLRFDARVTEIEELMSAYDARAVSPDQRAQWLHARSDLEEALECARKVCHDLSADRITDARAALDARARPSIAAADKDLWGLVELTANEGQALAQRIERARRRAAVLLFALEAACVGLAAALTVLAMRAVARYSRAVEARSRELEQFAARVAHDLRSPLSPVLVALGRLGKDVPQDDPRRTMVDRAVRGLGRVTTLVEDLLSFAMAGGRLDPAARASTLEAARAIVDDAATRAAAERIELRIDPRSEDLIAACSPGVLTSLMSNLVHNAIKYMGDAPDRRVTLRITRSGRRVRVEVEDTGPGLPPGCDEHVFEPYVRADRSGQPGLGLGLATVKRLVEAHRGSVGVRSRPSGCTFWFELPMGAEWSTPRTGGARRA